MADVFTKAKRSAVMARIQGKGNKATELALILLLRQHHLKGWRRNQPVFGRPDFVFRRGRITVFVDGCFWHGCPTHFKLPLNNQLFWRAKFEQNRARDKLVNRTLKALGWKVVRIWEHDLRAPKETTALNRLRIALDACNEGREGKVNTAFRERGAKLH